MKRFFFILSASIFLFQGICASAQEQISEEQVAAISKFFSEIKTLSCRFVQTNVSGDQKVVLKGEMYYIAPDKNLWRYITPISYGLLFDGDDIEFREGKKVNKDRKINKKKVVSHAETLMAVLAPDRVLGEFSVSVTRNEAKAYVKMIPVGKYAKKQFKNVSATFETATHHAEQISVVYKNGESIAIELYDVKINEPVDDAVFRIL